MEVTIIFHNADSRSAIETLHLPAVWCVEYREPSLADGDINDGSSRYYFTLSDPDGWHWYPGP